jgi:hypothetical protein
MERVFATLALRLFCLAKLHGRCGILNEQLTQGTQRSEGAKQKGDLVRQVLDKWLKPQISAMRTLLPLCCLLTVSAFGITGKPAVVTYVDATRGRQIYSFVTGENGHLVVKYWDGVHGWRWADLGLPAGAYAAVSDPSAIAYADPGKPEQMYAFVHGDNGHLFVDQWNGSGWVWSDQGLPPGRVSVDHPSAITYLDSAGRREIYVFCDRALVNYFDGVHGWRWTNLGIPAGTAGVLHPSAITYADPGGPQQMYVFFQGYRLDEGEPYLLVAYWDGVHGWQWANQSLSRGGQLISSPSATTYLDSAGRREIYVFCGKDQVGNLVVNYFDGVHGWQWADLGLPARANAVSNPSAIAYADSSGREQIYAFVQGDTGHLFYDLWNGSGWKWFDQGRPSGVAAVSNPSAISYVDAAGKRLIYAFGDANGGDLVVNWFDGSTWQWGDLGTL